MSSSKKRLCIAALVVAGLLSVFLSFAGLLFMLGAGGLPKPGVRLLWLNLFLPFFLSFPLFLLSLGITRFGIAGLWVTTLWELIIRMYNPVDLANPYIVTMLVFLLVQAFLVLYGSQLFRVFLLDQFFMYKFGANRDFAS
jgi:hypothetical protein